MLSWFKWMRRGVYLLLICLLISQVHGNLNPPPDKYLRYEPMGEASTTFYPPQHCFNCSKGQTRRTPVNHPYPFQDGMP